MAKLSLMFEDKLVKVVPIGSKPVRIGRSPDNDLVVDNLAVSNDHARVYFESGRLVVEDRGSLNGTFVNDLRVERATQGQRADDQRNDGAGYQGAAGHAAAGRCDG
jgi:pSer/pThr/pTyr-binding forkhead associated (FHA) protein